MDQGTQRGLRRLGETGGLRGLGTQGSVGMSLGLPPTFLTTHTPPSPSGKRPGLGGGDHYSSRLKNMAHQILDWGCSSALLNA